jgi:agmatinase
MTVEAYVQGFGCLPDPTPYDSAKAVVVPIPLEWGGGEVPGVGLGPMAVLGASRFIETFDSDLGFDPLDRGVATVDAPSLSYDSPERPLAQVQERIGQILGDGKLPLALGGERTLVVPMARAARALHSDVGVVHVTRRPGFLDCAQGRSLAPSTVGRRLAELGPTVVVGPRFWSADEARFMSQGDAPPVVTARQLNRDRLERLPWDKVPRRVHLSVDVGVMDPATLPMAGNVEPGGLDWFALTDVVDSIFRERDVMSVDISGFAPAIGQVAPSVVVAQLALRCLGRALS